MIDLLSTLSVGDLLLAVLVVVLASAASVILLGIVFVRIPAGYFSNVAPPRFLAGSPPWIYWTVRIVKNLIGVAVIFLGGIMALPGVPGPGILVALLGVMLTDFPAMRRFERWLVGRPGILSTINQLRQLHGKPPMYLDADPRVKQESSVLG
jgi:hypothetical protein